MEEKTKAARTYRGNDPGMDWECIEVFDQDGVEWYLYLNETTTAEWQSLKLSAHGRVPHKANYWFGWNGKRANNARDWQALIAHRPQLHKAVEGYLKRT